MEPSDTLFSLLNSQETNIGFKNNLSYTEAFNPYVFKNFYNGGGVAIGDVNNDGLSDIYLTGNQVENKLYINQGDFTFTDITADAGVACPDVWSSGAAMVDINGDGWLDIYVCKSGSPEDPGVRHNQAFINNGDLTFTDKSQVYGLDFNGLSVHTAFLDYDRDGDLDCYLLNNSLRSVGNYDLIKDFREQRDDSGGNRLLRNDHIVIINGDTLINDGPRFVDVSEETGIYGSAIGFGLGVSVGDMNGDHWPDLYVSNDFFERDYLYINNQDGTFSEELISVMEETSMGSMGADIADVNNDALPDVFVTEMLPKQLERTKTKAVYENWEKYKRAVDNGYHRQFARNVFQLNMGEKSDGLPWFAEVSRITGTEATDWSWGALIADYNNDGYKDIFIANGIGKDLLDQDYVNYYFNPENIKRLIKDKGEVMVEMFDNIPSEPLQNYLYMNRNGYQYDDSSAASGLTEKTFSNGSAYGDLDNDGDLDLVINNIDGEASVYRNNTDTLNQSVKIKLTYKDFNPYGIGSKLYAYHSDITQYIELNPMKGFQSSVDHNLIIGIGQSDVLDSLRIVWPDGTTQVLSSFSDNNKIIVSYDGEKTPVQEEVSKETFFQKSSILSYTHIENQHSDFDRERLAFYMRSNHGPQAAVGDLNGDSLDDLVIGGSKGNPLRVFIQKAYGGFTSQEESVFNNHKEAENMDVSLIDIDVDGDLDIWSIHGGSELPRSSSGLKDRIYLNDGAGRFSNSETFNAPYASSSAGVFLKDENILFSTSREVPFIYGVSPPVYFLDPIQGKPITESKIENDQLGMIHSAVSGDVDGDGDQDVLVAGHFTPLIILRNENGIFKIDPISDQYGWWNSVELSDLDNDGDLDILALNHGLNSRFKPDGEGYYLYTYDYDQNRTADQILTIKKGDSYLPIHQKDELINQIPQLKKNLIKYADYAQADMDDLFSKEMLDDASVMKVNHLASIILENVGGKYVIRELPFQAQLSTMYASLIVDVNGDGKKDLILGGNQFRAKPEIGINAASCGFLFINKGGLNYEYVPQNLSGIYEPGEIRDIELVHTDQGRHVLFLKNSARASSYKIIKN